MEIPFVGGSYEGRSKSLNAQRSINVFPVMDKNEPKSALAMYGTPGLTTFSTTGTSAIVRAVHQFGSVLYAVVGAVVYSVAANGTASNIGSITTSTGHVSMADNGTEVLISDGTTSGHLITAGSLADIADGDYPAATDNAFFDGYFIVVVASTGKIAISGSYDGTAWDALDFATAEAAADDLVGIGTTKQNLWLLGELTGEVYYNSGNADFPFERVPGAVIDEGCDAIGSITDIDGRVYWLTDKKKVVRSKGYAVEEISPAGVSYQISTYSTTSDSMGYTYTLEGRTFYVLTFPTRGVTWKMDTGSGQWIEWRTGAGVHLGVCSAVFNGAAIIGDKANGKLYTASMDVYTDDTATIIRTRRARIINKENVNVIHSRVEVEFEPGVGLDVGAEVDGYNPTCTLKWSDDNGDTYSSGKAAAIGTYQNRGTRAVFRGLGMARNRIYEITIDDPVKIVIIGAYANLIPCRV